MTTIIPPQPSHPLEPYLHLHPSSEPVTPPAYTNTSFLPPQLSHTKYHRSTATNQTHEPLLHASIPLYHTHTLCPSLSFTPKNHRHRTSAPPSSRTNHNPATVPYSHPTPLSLLCTYEPPTILVPLHVTLNQAPHHQPNQKAPPYTTRLEAQSATVLDDTPPSQLHHPPSQNRCMSPSHLHS